MIQVLLHPMDEDNVDSLAIEQLSEEKFDSAAEVIHGALLHDFVQSLEDLVLNQDLI